MRPSAVNRRRNARGGDGVRLPGDRRGRHGARSHANILDRRAHCGSTATRGMWIARDSRRTREGLSRFALHQSRLGSLITHTDSPLPTLRTAVPCWRKMAAPGRPSDSRAPPDARRHRSNAAERARARPSAHWPDNATRSIRRMIHTSKRHVATRRRIAAPSPRIIARRKSPVTNEPFAEEYIRDSEFRPQLSSSLKFPFISFITFI